MATKIVTKNSSTASAVPTASDLVQGELAVNVADKRLFTEDNAGAIVELGTNPSTIDINAGTIDGTTIGASSASTGAFTTLTATGAFTSRGIDDNADATAITIDSSENVGIGTSSINSNAALEVHGGQLRVASSSASSMFAVATSTTYSDGVTLFSSYNGSGAYGPMIFDVNGERMRIDSSGNVGIGTSSPSSLLHLSSSAPTLQFSETDVGVQNYIQASGGGFNFFADDTNAASGTKMGFFIDGSERMRIDSSGNVGVGTTSPSSFNYLSTSPHLVIGGGSSDAGVTCYSSTNGYGRLAFADGTNTTEQYRGLIQFYHGDNSMQFYTGSDERMRIDSSGNLLVGKTASGTVQGFEVQQDGEVYTTIVNGLNTYHVYANSGYRFYVKPDGGIVNYSSNNVNLSDEREKKNIEPLESQWDSLKQWSLKKFHYSADVDSDNKKLGVIAQEVETHNPEVIDEFNVDDETTRMAVKEQQMMWMAIKALQEAQTRIETLEARVTELENN